MIQLCTGFFSANEKGMEYPPEMSKVFKSLGEESVLEIMLEEDRAKELGE